MAASPIKTLLINSDKTHWFLEVKQPDINEFAKIQEVIKAADLTMSFRTLKDTPNGNATELEIFIKGESYITLGFDGGVSDSSQEWQILGIALYDVGPNQNRLPDVWANYLALWGLD